MTEGEIPFPSSSSSDEMKPSTTSASGKFLDRSHPAPQFTADALVKGTVRTVNLSDYLGRWLILFFYSSDFTFV